MARPAVLMATTPTSQARSRTTKRVQSIRNGSVPSIIGTTAGNMRIPAWKTCADGTLRSGAKHLHILKRHQTFRRHLVEVRQEDVKLFFSIHDLDHERQIAGEPQDLRGVQMALCSEAHGAAQHRRARQSEFACLQHDGLVERLVMPAVALAEENTEQFRPSRSCLTVHAGLTSSGESFAAQETEPHCAKANRD